MRLIAISALALAVVAAFVLASSANHPAEASASFCQTYHEHDHRILPQLERFRPDQSAQRTRALFRDMTAGLAQLRRAAPAQIAADVAALAELAREQQDALASVDYRFRDAPRSSFTTARGDAALANVERFRASRCGERAHDHDAEHSNRTGGGRR